MVYVRDSNSDWVLYDIVQDYQGSITHLVDDSDGTVVAEYSYDPWGRLRDPQTLAIYTPRSASSPILLLGRGYTAHEHLDWFGLINMNARLYDPALGRFLSPDPYVQAPDFSQSFNRYSYCLNNPLKYTDPTGEVFGLDDFLIAAVIGGAINWLFNGAELSWKGLGYFAGGALVGGLSAGAGAWVASSFQACGVFAGAGIGAVTGGLTGGVTNVAQNGLNNLLNGQNFFSGWGSSFASGALVGGIAGALSGGIAGGKQALDSGKNVWWGKEVKHGRNQWSLFNWEKPQVFSSPVNSNFGNVSGECVFRCLEEFSSSYGLSEYDFDYWKNLNGHLGVHPSEVESLVKKSGVFAAKRVVHNDTHGLVSLIKENKRLMLGFSKEGIGGHAVMISKIKYWSDGTAKLFFKETSPVRIIAPSLKIKPGVPLIGYGIWSFFKL